MKLFLPIAALLFTDCGFLLADNPPKQDKQAQAEQEAKTAKAKKAAQTDKTDKKAAPRKPAETEGTTASEPGAKAEEAPADLVAVKKAIVSYVAAFNKHDAKALAAHWGEEGEFTTPDGVTLRGGKEIEAEFAAYFAETEKARLELEGTAVEFLSPSVAVETGLARVIVPGEEPSETEYEAIHVKTAAGWKIDSVREQEPPAPPPSSYEKLKELEWMVGEWVDADENAVIESNCRWTANRNFLVRSFKVFVQDRVDFEGTQIVGWDPVAQVIRSWTFDSDGGFGAGRWSGGNGQWSVQTLNVLPDGRRASATSVYQLVDENTVKFHTIGRQADGVLLPNIDPVTIVRRSAE